MYGRSDGDHVLRGSAEHHHYRYVSWNEDRTHYELPSPIASIHSAYESRLEPIGAGRTVCKALYFMHLHPTEYACSKES